MLKYSKSHYYLYHFSAVILSSCLFSPVMTHTIDHAAPLALDDVILASKTIAVAKAVNNVNPFAELATDELINPFPSFFKTVEKAKLAAAAIESVETVVTPIFKTKGLLLNSDNWRTYIATLKQNGLSTLADLKTQSDKLQILAQTFYNSTLNNATEIWTTKRNLVIAITAITITGFSVWHAHKTYKKWQQRVTQSKQNDPHFKTKLC